MTETPFAIRHFDPHGSTIRTAITLAGTLRDYSDRQPGANRSFRRDISL